MPGVPLLFDLDGTIVDSALGIATALTEMSCARGGEPVAAARVRKLVSQGAATLVREALGPVAGTNADDLATFRRILATVPAAPDSLYPGVVDCLCALADQGHPLAIVTNKPEVLSLALLRDLGLAPLFGCVVGGDTLAVAKPDPAPLRHALAGLGRSDAMGIMIGDSAVDARAAAAAGLPFMLFEGGYAPDECAAVAVAARFGDYGTFAAALSGLLESAASA